MNEFLQRLLDPILTGGRASLDALQQDLSRVSEGRAPDQLIKAVSQAASMADTPGGVAMPTVQLGPYLKMRGGQVVEHMQFPDITPTSYLLNVLSPKLGRAGEMARTMADELGGGVKDLMEGERFRQIGNILRKYDPYGLGQ